MAVKVVVPELGESIVEATVGRWLKKVGDSVKIGDVLVSLETDKVDVEVGSEQSGVLAEIVAQEGADVAIGAILGLIDESAAADGAKLDGVKPAVEPAAPLPKAGIEEPALAAEPAAPAKAAEKEGATPVARRLAQEQGVDISQVPGSGPGGRVTKQDVQAFAAQQRLPEGEQRTADRRPPTADRGPETGDRETSYRRPATVRRSDADQQPATSNRREERVRMSRRRRTIAARLVEAQRTAAMLTTFNEIDMSAVMDLRKRRQEAFQQRHGVKLGFMSFFVKAAVSALKAFPQVNAEIDGDEIILKHYYDIGMAVGAEEGLVVPVLRDADQMSFAEIERTIKELADKVRDGTLTLEELRGGTFTITNGGVFGSLLSTPILNPPQVGILGLHKIEERPIARDGQVVIRPMMYVALSYDHRLVDGREAVQFLVRVKELVEEPALLLLEG